MFPVVSFFVVAASTDVNVRKGSSKSLWAKPSVDQRIRTSLEHACALARAVGQDLCNTSGWIRWEQKHAFTGNLPSRLRRGETDVELLKTAEMKSVLAPEAVEEKRVRRVKEMYEQGVALKSIYNAAMTKAPTLGDTGQLSRSLDKFLGCEQRMIKIYHDGAGKLELSGEALPLFLDIIDAIASAFDDLNKPSEAVQYYEKLLEYDRCMLTRQTNATLEYEYCSGRYHSRALLMYRYLNLPGKAKHMYNRAISLRYNGERVHWWPNSWQIPTMYMLGLRGQPFWDGSSKLPLASALEKNYKMFREEFLQTLAHPDYKDIFTQNDHVLITSGTWGELKLFDGKTWRAPCNNTAAQTCSFLSSRTELVGKIPSSKTHNVNLPRESGYFKLLPGSRLKPHTGPVNFHLYCHLGLVVPPGPKLRVGRGEPREWEEGKALCFDDSFDHEAWHDGTEARYVLMVTFYHPDLGTPEKDEKIPLPPLRTRKKRRKSMT